MPSGWDIPGGHKIQFAKTAEALRESGLEVRTSTDAVHADLDGLDVVHGFGVDPVHLRHCHLRGLPVAVSTIYWARNYRMDGVRRQTFRSTLGALKRSVRFTSASMRGRAAILQLCLTEARSEVRLAMSYEAADMLLPNSHGEADAIRSEMDVSTPMSVVPNAADSDLFPLGEAAFEERQTVLSVGRIEPHKNQLGLIRALESTGFRLVIVGASHPHHAEYARECHEAGRGWVQFVGPLDHAELGEQYRKARVHVLPTWFETTGLVSLEAALSGCNIVSTSRGHAREYLEDYVEYCDPSDVDSIRQATIAAWNRPPSLALRDKIVDQYSWERCATETVAAYRMMLERK